MLLVGGRVALGARGVIVYQLHGGDASPDEAAGSEEEPSIDMMAEAGSAAETQRAGGAAAAAAAEARAEAQLRAETEAKDAEQAAAAAMAKTKQAEGQAAAAAQAAEAAKINAADNVELQQRPSLASELAPADAQQVTPSTLSSHP